MHDKAVATEFEHVDEPPETFSVRFKRESETIAEIRRLQASSVGYLLIRCGRLWNDKAIAAVNAEAPRFVLREAHTRMLPFLLEPGGVRITDLARRLKVTKQAVQPLVSEMVEAGFVRVEPDPEDGRARLVHVTAQGFQAYRHGTHVLKRIEDEVAEQVGPKAMGNLLKLLSDLQSALSGD